MYNTINELATIIKVAIDAYWRLEKNRDDLFKEIEEIFDEPKHCGIVKGWNYILLSANETDRKLLP